MKTVEKSSSVDWALLSIRAIAGSILIAHGLQKVFGAFGGPGLDGFVQAIGPIGYLVAMGELLGGLGLLVGFLSRFSAASNIAIMLGAIITVHGKNGFFSQGGGYEYNLALIGLLLPILIAGPGRFALSSLVSSVLSRRSPSPLTA